MGRTFNTIAKRKRTKWPKVINKIMIGIESFGILYQLRYIIYYIYAGYVWMLSQINGKSQWERFRSYWNTIELIRLICLCFEWGIVIYRVEGSNILSGEEESNVLNIVGISYLGSAFSQFSL